MTASTIVIANVSAGYLDEPIVRDFSMTVEPGRITVLIGPNGAGKSTLLRAVYGLNRLFAGRIALDGEDIQLLSPRARFRRGVAFVPQGRCNFPLMSVRENLELGGYTLDRAANRRAIEQVEATFPVLAAKAGVLAGNLSGGEQQIMEMAMAMMTRPKVILLDEPSIGLSPANVRIVFDMVRRIRDGGVSVLMVEQNVKAALRIADIAVVMELGRKFAEGPSGDIARDPRIAAAYLGGSAAA